MAGEAVRSFLYVPAHRPEMLEKSLGRGADALIIDLEDAVPLAAKDEARQHLAHFLGAHASTEGRPQIWVRINPGAQEADLEAAVRDGVTGLCLAKADLPQAQQVAAGLDRLEAERAIDTPLALSPLLETAAAVLDAAAIARAPRVVRLQVGEADLAAELGVSIGPDERELLWVRSQVVLASSAAGIEPPVGPVSTNFTDTEALRTSTQALARLGYRGRCCIHPAQVSVVNEVFTPSRDQVEAAAALVSAYQAAGSGAFTAPDGRMVDEAVIRAARRLLASGHLAG